MFLQRRKWWKRALKKPRNLWTLICNSSAREEDACIHNATDQTTTLEMVIPVGQIHFHPSQVKVTWKNGLSLTTWTQKAPCYLKSQNPKLSSWQRSRKINTTFALQIVNTMENKYPLPTNKPLFSRAGNSIHLLFFPGRNSILKQTFSSFYCTICYKVLPVEEAMHFKRVGNKKWIGEFIFLAQKYNVTSYRRQTVKGRDFCWYSGIKK